MMEKRNSLYVAIAVLNSFLFLFIPDYFFWFVAVLAIGGLICLVILVNDMVRKTSRWKDALKIFGLGVASYLLGVLIMIIRNFLLGYYSK